MITELGETKQWHLRSQEKKVPRRSKWTAALYAAKGSNEMKTLKYPLDVATWRPLVTSMSHCSKAVAPESRLQWIEDGKRSEETEPLSVDDYWTDWLRRRERGEVTASWT